MAVLKRRHKKAVTATGSRMFVGSELTPDQVIEFCNANDISIKPLDIKKLIKHLGISLKKKPLRDNISGFLKKMDGSWEITINSLHHPRRQRFTMAHELAHYILHSSNQVEFVDEVLFRADAKNVMEWEANSFAGELLIPEVELKSSIASGVRRVEDIAAHFGVSAMAVRVRARELGLQGHNL
jgi:Zn-dependent peptidase ImmA (M78 family)